MHLEACKWTMGLFSGHLLDTLDCKIMSMCFEPMQVDLQSFSFETSLEVCEWTESLLGDQMDTCWSLKYMEGWKDCMDFSGRCLEGDISIDNVQIE